METTTSCGSPLFENPDAVAIQTEEIYKHSYTPAYNFKNFTSPSQYFSAQELNTSKT